MSRPRWGSPFYVDDQERIDLIESVRESNQRQILEFLKKKGFPVTVRGIRGYYNGATRICGECEKEFYHWSFGGEVGCSSSCSKLIRFRMETQKTGPKPEPEPEPIPYEIDLFLHKLRPTFA